MLIEENKLSKGSILFKTVHIWEFIKNEMEDKTGWAGIGMF